MRFERLEKKMEIVGSSRKREEGGLGLEAIQFDRKDRTRRAYCPDFFYLIM